jgi:hypothetical protein
MVFLSFIKNNTMITNIVEATQKKLVYPSLKKVDANIQETKENASQTTKEKLAQSAIPVVLAGLYSFTRSDDGCNYLLSRDENINWLNVIFGDKKQKVVENVAHYAGVSIDEAAINMADIASVSVALIQESGGEKTTAEKIKSFMSGQRHNILVYLPAALQSGDLLNDNAMDDRTNKMEGPISGLMHSIENKFSGGGS